MTTTAPITNAHTADEEEMMLSVVRELVAESVAPRAAAIDETASFRGTSRSSSRRTICSASRFPPNTAG